MSVPVDDIEAARKLLGHTTQKQTAQYIRPVLGELANALEPPEVERLTQIVEGLDTESTDKQDKKNTVESNLRT